MCILRVGTDDFLEIESARRYTARNTIPTAKIAGTTVRLVICFVAVKKFISGRSSVGVVDALDVKYLCTLMCSMGELGEL